MKIYEMARSALGVIGLDFGIIVVKKVVLVQSTMVALNYYGNDLKSALSCLDSEEKEYEGCSLLFTIRKKGW